MAVSARADAIARLRLIRSANIGPVTYRQLLLRFGTAAAALEAVPDLARRGGGREARLANPAEIEREAEALRAAGGRYLFSDDPAYPALLDAIDTAPPVISIRGDVALLARPMVAVVGARNASAAGCRFARGLCRELAEAEVTIVSGLARGIDTAAHQGSLEYGTIAVIAGGIDIAYPPENAELQEAIATRGLLIAEQPPGTEPRARHFPYRNRIIAGIAQATLVVEAALQSGSLITARLAGEFGREVLAVPGSPLDPRALGCNQLIREGATLVGTADEVLEAIRPIDARALRAHGDLFTAPPVAADASPADRRAIAALLGPVPVGVDELVRQSGTAPAIVHTVLLELELAGRLDRHAGSRVSLVD